MRKSKLNTMYKSVLWLPILTLTTLSSSCVKSKSDDRCLLKPDAGNCEAYMPRYYYDNKSGKCKEFIWGGCQGTVPFETLKECKTCE